MTQLTSASWPINVNILENHFDRYAIASISIIAFGTISIVPPIFLTLLLLVTPLTYMQTTAAVAELDEQLDFVHGLANAELDIPMTQETLIQIGSTTKVFTAMLVMSLVEGGLLDLDTPVIEYIPIGSTSCQEKYLCLSSRAN